MISVTRFNGSQVVVNDDHLLFVEATPDTILTFTTGLHMMVRESVEEIVSRCVAYRRRTLEGAPRTGAAPAPILPPRPEEG